MAFAEQLLSYLDLAWTIFKWTWPFLILVYLFVLKMKWKNWPIEAVIVEKRGSNLVKTNDRMGKFYDKYTGITGYKLMKAKDTMPILNFDWVLHSNVQNTNFFERLVNLLRPTIGTVLLFKYGSKQYKPVEITENGKTKLEWKELRDAKGNVTMINVYQQFDPRDKLGALNFDVVDWDNMNFMVQEQRASIERRKKKGQFLKEVIIPLAMLAVTAIICIIMIKFAADWRPGAIPDSSQTPAKIPIASDLLNPGN